MALIWKLLMTTKEIGGLILPTYLLGIPAQNSSRDEEIGSVKQNSGNINIYSAMS